MDKPLRKLANLLRTECLCEHNHALHRDGGKSCGGGSSSSGGGGGGGGSSSSSSSSSSSKLGGVGCWQSVGVQNKDF